MTTLKGVFPESKPVGRKNFIQENVKNLRRMEHCFHTSKDIDDLQKVHMRKHNKYQNVTSRVSTNFHEKKYNENAAAADGVNKKEEDNKISRKNSAPILSKNSAFSKKGYHSSRNENLPAKQKRRDKRSTNKPTQKMKGKVSSDPNLAHKAHENDGCDSNSKGQTKFKSQAIQTLDSKEVDDIYSEGSIKYASTKVLSKLDDKDTNENHDQIDNNIKEIVSPPNMNNERAESIYQGADTKHTDPLMQKNDIDFIKLNKERASVASKMAVHLNSSAVLPSNYKKGIVPKYIRDRKEAQEKDQRERAETLDPDCPEGHIALPDSERKETLHMLKKNYQDYVNELNKMPIKSDTLRAQRRKMEIEKQLTKLEEGIKVFSRPKVYLKVNA